MKLRKTEIITCPHCGAEYLPAEIYVPQAFIGTTKTIIKDKDGKIVDFDNESMCLSENYICDYCDKKFHVRAKPNFLVTAPLVSEFATDFTSSLKEDQFTLEEDI